MFLYSSWHAHGVLLQRESRSWGITVDVDNAETQETATEEQDMADTNWLNDLLDILEKLTTQTTN